ncbi:MAG: glycerophosphodiester phosphodiesterase [Planctomyces sp.]|nr:glycerophosphodiester phosphodiesterase [Planctomyces sp.]
MPRSRFVIAHRGASGYLPEHTSEAKALAHAMEADFLEQDVVLTQDDIPVVLHDIHLDTVTDVATRFPGRQRDDGRFYVLDFTLDELSRLQVTERIDLKTGRAVYPNRFPAWSGEFRISTLRDELALIAGLNRSTGRSAGIYPELKLPAWHRGEGRDLAAAVLRELSAAGYRDASANVFVQCFDAAELRRLREELGCTLPLVQLIGENRWADARDDFERMCAADGLAELARTVQGIGPGLNRVIAAGGAATELTSRAHDAGLVVHPFTVRADALPAGFDSLDDLHAALFEAAGVDGVFTDFPDRTRQWLLGHARG